MLSCFFSLRAYLVENCLHYETISSAPALTSQNSVCLSYVFFLGAALVFRRTLSQLCNTVMERDHKCTYAFI
jgi:hypothetical protein